MKDLVAASFAIHHEQSMLGGVGGVAVVHKRGRVNEGQNVHDWGVGENPVWTATRQPLKGGTEQRRKMPSLANINHLGPRSLAMLPYCIELHE